MLQCKVHMRLSCYDAGFKVNVGVEIRDHLNCIQLIRCIIIRGVRVVEDTYIVISCKLCKDGERILHVPN